MQYDAEQDRHDYDSVDYGFTRRVNFLFQKYPPRHDGREAARPEPANEQHDRRVGILGSRHPFQPEPLSGRFRPDSGPLGHGKWAVHRSAVIRALQPA